MNRRLMLSLVLALLPVLAVAALYGRLPDQVPIQWGLEGEVSYGPKVTLWGLALLSPGLLALLRVLPKVDPRRRNYARFQGCYDGFCLVLTLFLGGLVGVVLVESLRPGTISVGRVVTFCVGLLLVFLGNLLPKVKNNFFMGVRTPWTLSDPDVWNRANRLGGRCFFWFGLALAAGGLLLPEAVNFLLLLAGVAVVVILPGLMSYIWYQKKQKDPVDK